jgi:WD40 repeat protein
MATRTALLRSRYQESTSSLALLIEASVFGQERFGGSLARPLEGILSSALIFSSSFGALQQNGECLHTLEGHNSFVLGVRVHEKQIYSNSQDGTIRVWSIKVCVIIHQAAKGQAMLTDMYGRAES